MDIIEKSNDFECQIFVTGMHTLKKYGYTYSEIKKCIHKNIIIFNNQNYDTKQEIILANTVKGISKAIDQLKPDLIVVHGDRIEALAGAISGSFNNILVSHIEGGEISGTIDELMRHAITKLSHLHFVANEIAKKRLIQLGELESSVHIIGSPDIDIMRKEGLPDLDYVKKYYGIKFNKFAILIFHPTSTEISELKNQIKNIISALKKEKGNFIIIYPNNDLGSDIIINEYKKIKRENFKVFSSLRFQYFLTLLKNAQFIIGNSSAGIREAEVYGTPIINIGNRQKNRSDNRDIINIPAEIIKINEAILKIKDKRFQPKNNFGRVKNSDLKFIKKLRERKTWSISIQKQFIDIFKN